MWGLDYRAVKTAVKLARKKLTAFTLRPSLEWAFGRDGALRRPAERPGKHNQLSPEVNVAARRPYQFRNDAARLTAREPLVYFPA